MNMLKITGPRTDPCAHLAHFTWTRHPTTTTIIIIIIIIIMVKFTLEQATKSQRRSRGIAPLFP
jgi:uncharacterized membrane protein YgaE (UPF0421/DUF939 family)